MKTVNYDFNCVPDNRICPQCTASMGVLSRDKYKVLEVLGEKRFVRVQGSPELTAEDIVDDIDPMIRSLRHPSLQGQPANPLRRRD